MHIDWENIFTLMRQAVRTGEQDFPAISTIAQENQDPFRVLISTLISLRTKDSVTIAASRRLFALADSPHAMLSLSPQTIEEAIYPAGFYRIKTKNILEISKMLIQLYGGKVPSQKEALLQLPGVGTKTANLTLNLGFGIDAICVDIHVHRIANRMGWVSTNKPEKTEVALEKIMPQRFWIPLNELLVTYGQQICRPISPFCSKCTVYSYCKRVGVTRSR
ncbi:MAG: endonuclease III [Sphaerochaetaceae bacterium]|nr:endonuclease III [Sphaerochaetaceae bacterium]MDD4219780.1 endonuclease III [Sphaerochaetaceae bacterium]